MSQFYKIHLAFNRGCFEAIFVKNTLGCLGVKDETALQVWYNFSHALFSFAQNFSHVSNIHMS
jgi:hypothetical protein